MDLQDKKKKIIKNLENIYKKALLNNNLNIAIQAQKAIASVINSFENRYNYDITLSSLTNQQIEDLINESERNDILQLSKI